MADKDFQIRNSTVDFLVFTKQNSTDSIQVRVHDENVWLTQKSMAQLFECSIDKISLHIKNIFKDGEIIPEAVIEESSATASDVKQYKTKFYNLDAKSDMTWDIVSLIHDGVIGFDDLKEFSDDLKVAVKFILER